MKRASAWVLWLAGCGAAVGCQGLIGGEGDGEGGVPAPAACSGACMGASGLMRLSRTEYLHAVEAVFGSVALDPAQLPFDASVGPFTANDGPLTESDVSDYHQAAWSIAEELAPALAGECDATSCVSHLLSSYGEALFRRPITDADLAAYGELFDWSMSSDTLTASVELVVATMLEAPDFLYRVEHAADGDAPTQLRGIEVANRLALFLWQEGPDATLRAAAAAGDLDAADGVRAHARRMLDDPRADRAIASFHAEWLGIVDIPDIDAALAGAMRNESERFAVDVFRNQGGRLETLFTGEHTSVDDVLAAHYGVAAGDDVVVPGHVGILTHASVLLRYGSASYTRPVRRGDMLLSRVLCHSVGVPPPDALDQAEEANAELPDGLSDRDRLAAVTGESPCNGCHSVINPAGYVFEGFDQLGRHRTADAYGNPIDSSGSLADIGDLDATFDGPAELMPALAKSATASACIGEQWVQFALHREIGSADDPAVAIAAQALGETGDLRELVVAIAGSDAFRYRLPRKVP
jgi:uncharacterized protein DUF1592/uncharacterized protein DUF1588/uncharacterized protein DUF1585/uncharacterized protein DUF1595